MTMSMSGALRPWVTASAGYFAYMAAVAIFLPGVSRQARRTSLAFSAAGLLLVVVAAALPINTVAHGWLLPPLLLLAGYWGSGVLFTAPMPRIERLLLALDEALQIRAIAARLPRWAGEFLELAYAAVYLLVPIALAIVAGRAAPAAGGSADRFWAVILLTDYVCFATLPWIQTRPPRQIEAGEPWPAVLRSGNLRLLGAASIRVNTFPSGHAAEALALALLVSDASPGIATNVMVFSAAAVSAGAVFGRYHYAADALAGWGVAFAVWYAFR
jgi:hypothetical protein